MNPTTLLAAAGILPAKIGAALPGLVLDRVVIRPAPVWLARVWGKPVSAMAIRNTIYFRPDILDRDPSDLGPLLVHELVHVHQWSQLGFFRFLWQYVSGYLRGRLTGLSHRDAYRAIPIEVEARELTNQLLGPG